MRRKSLCGYIIPHLLRALFHRRQTIRYPQGALELSEAYRGAVTVDIAKCTGCGRCARDCPTQALVVTRLPDGGVRVALDYGACAECDQCELSCPRDAIYPTPRFREAGLDRDDMVLVWERDKQERSG